MLGRCAVTSRRAENGQRRPRHEESRGWERLWIPQVFKWSLPVGTEGTTGKPVTQIPEYQSPQFTFPPHHSTRVS